MLRSPLLALLIALAAAAPAAAASLPKVSTGERPGPPLLYAPPADAPELSVKAPFRAPPLLVSGSEAYREGEYLYQDYLFDDRGADTRSGGGNRGGPRDDIAASTAGDVFYPTADRYAGNAADLVELRVKPTPDALVYRITLTTAKAPDTAVVGIGIDADRSGGAPVLWPKGAGIASPGLDHFITAWGKGGEVDGKALPAGAVQMDTTANQMTVRVPRSVLDPGSRAVWRHVAGVGLWSGNEWKTPRTGRTPTAEEPASGGDAPAPAVFNLAFRFDEPQSKEPLPPYTTFPGIGNWFEDKQSRALIGRTSGDFFADVDFGKLAAGVTEDGRRRAGREQARIFPSALDVPEGVTGSERFPGYGGRLQPYLVTVPPGYDPARPAPLTFSLHSLGGTYTQYAVFSPTQLRQFGDQRNSLVVTTLGRGTNGWYTDEAEADFFEVWADVARHFNLDSEQVALSGYSMGGYGTYKLGTQYPDLFGKAFTTVGPPGRGIWVPPAPPSDGQFTNSNLVLENARWVPYLNWVEAADQLVPYTGPRAQQARFDALGLRSQLWTFSPGEHFTLAITDRWDAARDFLRESRVVRDPWRVHYAFVPAADRPKLGLVHDHAYWVSKLRARNAAGDPRTAPARAEIDARSLAFGDRDPATRPVRGATATAGPPNGATIEGTEWGDTPRAAPENALTAALRNVGSGEISGVRARLDGARRLRVTLDSDGPATLRLALPFPRQVQVERVDEEAVPAPEVAVDAQGATFAVPAGRRTYRISPGPSFCSDTVKPTSRFTTSSRTASRTRGRLIIQGRASDATCPGRRARIRRVSLAIGKTTGRNRCRFMDSRGRYGALRPCSRTTYIPARGTTAWSLRLPRRLTRGRYIVWSRATDLAGNNERKAASRNRLRITIRRR
ncbi:MAG: alpha/beta hydrolase-fold protein [Actinomycetota bacterium]|nr:alpha/beta hydrolase-fold protein [Actinomycetota bacterium]